MPTGSLGSGLPACQAALGSPRTQRVHTRKGGDCKQAPVSISRLRGTILACNGLLLQKQRGMDAVSEE